MKLTATIVLLLVSGTAMANARVASVTAKQAAPLEAQVTVSIDRPTPLDMTCDATVDFGDGSTRQLKWDVADKRAKTLQHKYAKAGTYKVVAAGTGKCGGSREASISVLGGPAGASAAKAHCPSGWTLVADSVRDDKYICHANPPSTPIKCAGSTQYFAEKGTIGCK